MKYSIGDKFRLIDSDGDTYIGIIYDVAFGNGETLYKFNWADGDVSVEYHHSMEGMTHLNDSTLPEELFIL